MTHRRSNMLPSPTVADTPVHDASSRTRLIEAALEIFERKGYAATSVREIVERAGVTKPALYYYFGSKQGLLVAILETGARDLQAVVEEAARQGGSARDRVRRVCLAVNRLVRSRLSELRVAHAVYFTAAELVPLFDLEVFDRALIGAIEGSVRAGVAAGEIRPVNAADATVALLGVLVLSFDQEILRRSNRLDEAGLGRVIDLVFDGLCHHS